MGIARVVTLPRLALAGALGVSLALRLWGIDFGAGQPRARPDEEIFIHQSLRMFGDGHAKEVIATGWPEGFFLVAHGLHRLELAALNIGTARERLTDDVHLGCLYAVNPLALELPLRLFSVLMSVFGCFVAGLIVRQSVLVIRLFEWPRFAIEPTNRYAVALGVLAMGLNYLDVRDAHFGVSDATMCSLCLLCLYFCLRATLHVPKWLVAAGITAGMAFAVKYAAAPIAASCVASTVVCFIRYGRHWRYAAKWTALAVVGAAVGFAVLCPDGAMHPLITVQWLHDQHLHRFSNETAAAYTLNPVSIHPPGWHFYFGTVVPAAIGPIGLGAATVGLVVAWHRHRSDMWVLASGIAAFAAVLVPVTTQQVRYAAPLTAILSVCIGIALAHIPVLPISFVVALLSLWRPMVNSVEFDAVLGQPDTRDLAARLVADNFSSIVPEGAYAHVHSLEEGVLRRCQTLLPRSLRQRDVPVLVGDMDRVLPVETRQSWATTSSNALNSYLWTRDTKTARYRTRARSILACGRLGKSEGWAPMDGACWEEVNRFSPGATSCDGYVDEFDSFYVPFTGFNGVHNPGPDIRIYENRCGIVGP